MFPGNWLRLFGSLDEAQAYSGPMGKCSAGEAMSVDDVTNVQVVDEILRKETYEQTSSQSTQLEPLADDSHLNEDSSI